MVGTRWKDRGCMWGHQRHQNLRFPFAWSNVATMFYRIWSRLLPRGRACVYECECTCIWKTIFITKMGQTLRRDSNSRPILEREVAISGKRNRTSIPPDEGWCQEKRSPVPGERSAVPGQGRGVIRSGIGWMGCVAGNGVEVVGEQVEDQNEHESFVFRVTRDPWLGMAR